MYLTGIVSAAGASVTDWKEEHGLLLSLSSL